MLYSVRIAAGVCLHVCACGRRILRASPLKGWMVGEQRLAFGGERRKVTATQGTQWRRFASKNLKARPSPPTGPAIRRRQMRATMQEPQLVP
jgi:hypothetical protein